MTTHTLSHSRASSFRPMTVFLWKEFASITPLALALTALGVMIQLAGLAARPLPPPAYFHGVAVAMAILFAIAAAGTRFAMEYEDGTRQWLLALPLEGWTVFLAKGAAVALASMATLLVLIAVAQFCLSVLGPVPSGAVVPASWQLIGRSAPILLLGITWGFVFSLVLRRPLVAVLITVAFLSLLQLATNRWIPFFSPKLTEGDLPLTPPDFSFSAIAGLVLSIVLGGQWLNRKTTRNAVGDFAFARPSSRSRLLPDDGSVVGPSHLRGMAVLLWQTVRESWGYLLLAAIAASFVPILVAEAARVQFLMSNQHYLIAQNFHVPTIRPLALMTLHLVATSAAAIYGSAVFAADHAQAKYRILGTMPVRPSTVWWARLLIAFLPIFLIAVLVWIRRPSTWIGDESAAGYLRRTDHAWSLAIPLWTFLGRREMASAILAGLCGGFAVGQLTSLLCRSSIIAGVIAVVVAVPLWIWGGALSIWQLPLLGLYLPIPMILLVLSRWHMGLLLQERRSWKSTFATALAILIPLLALVGVVAGRNYGMKDELHPLPIGVLFYEKLQEWLLDQASDGNDLEDGADQQAVETLMSRTRALPRSVGEFVVEHASEFIDAPAGSIPIDLEALVRELSLDGERHAGVEDAIRLSQQLRMPPPNVLWSATDDQQLARIVAGLERRAGELTQAGDLVGALEHNRAAMRWRIFRRRGSVWLVDSRELESALYGWLVWARHREQTPELLARARSDLNQLLPTTKNEWLDSLQHDPSFFPMAPAPIDALHDIRDLLLHPREIESRLRSAEWNLWDPQQFTTLARRLQEFPGESSRSLRLLDRYAREVLRALGQLHEASNGMLSQRRTTGLDSVEVSIASLLRMHANDLLTVDVKWDSRGNATCDKKWSSLVTNPMLQPMVEYLWRQSRFHFVVNQTIIRGAKLQLDLLAFRLQHDRFPSDLVELTEHMPFELPLQPITNTPFEYRPGPWQSEGEIGGFVSGIVPWFPMYPNAQRSVPPAAPTGWRPFLGNPMGLGFSSQRFYVDAAEFSSHWSIPSFLFLLKLSPADDVPEQDEANHPPPLELSPPNWVPEQGEGDHPPPAEESSRNVSREATLR